MSTQNDLASSITAVINSLSVLQTTAIANSKFDMPVAVLNSFVTTLASVTNGLGSISPSAPPAAPTPPVTTSAYLPNGLSSTTDSRGCVMIKAIEDERANNPKWANACKWYYVEEVLSDTNYNLTDDQKFQIHSNLWEAKTLLVLNTPPLNAQCLNNAYPMTRSQTGGLYQRGTPYADALSFIGTNISAMGTIGYASPGPGQMAAFVANCNASGELPVIDHQPPPTYPIA